MLLQHDADQLTACPNAGLREQLLKCGLTELSDTPIRAAISRLFARCRRVLAVTTYNAFRICQTATEVASHSSVAPARTIHGGSLCKNCETASAKTSNPMLPMDDPAASTLAAFLPRAVPWSPRDFFSSFSCFSMSVALAGKIAGNAKNNPPIPGPNFLAIIPAKAVMIPPNRNRTAYSYHFPCRMVDRSTWIRITI